MNCFEALVERFHEQPWQIVAMRHMIHIVVASHYRNMFVRVGIEVTLGHSSFRSTQQIYNNLDALLPAIWSCKDQYPSYLQTMLICCIDVFESFFDCFD